MRWASTAVRRRTGWARLRGVLPVVLVDDVRWRVVEVERLPRVSVSGMVQSIRRFATSWTYTLAPNRHTPYSSCSPHGSAAAHPAHPRAADRRLANAARSDGRGHCETLHQHPGVMPYRAQLDAA